MERDDIIEYSLDAHHSDEEGRKIRKNIVKVTIILTVVTVLEVGLGIWGSSMGISRLIIMALFIGLTILKAAYIILVFMHLGDERTSLKWTILTPYCLFVGYLIFICLTEALRDFDLRPLFE